MLKKRKFLIGGIILFLAIGYLGLIGFNSSATFYYMTSELLEQGSSVYGETVRVNGDVVPGSLEQDGVGSALRFTISDGKGSLPVVYRGVVPDTFKVGAEVVVEGKLNSTGIFQASTLMPKCPSRYVPE